MRFYIWIATMMAVMLMLNSNLQASEMEYLIPKVSGHVELCSTDGCNRIFDGAVALVGDTITIGVEEGIYLICPSLYNKCAVFMQGSIKLLPDAFWSNDSMPVQYIDNAWNYKED